MKSLIESFKNSSVSSKLAVLVLIAIWAMVFIAIVVGFVLLAEQRSVAQEPNPELALPMLTLTPTNGAITTPITLLGSGWTPGSTVLIYLSTLQETELPPHAVMSIVPDSTGQFIATLTFPANIDGEADRAIKVIAREIGREFTTHALFTLSDFGGQQMDKPADPVPTAIPTQVVVVKDTILPPSPGTPLATANTNVNIRNGPGLVYPVIGVLQTGQNVEVTGLSPDKAWWQIKFSGVMDGRGWVSAAYVTTQNTDNLPIVQLIVLPITPTPVPPTPVPPAPIQIIITDWRGEYFNNPGLSGTPVLVRNDPAIQFSWGPGSPGPGVPVDNFSVRWTRTLHFAAGKYRFKVLVDDGVRLWVDGNLVLDRWYPTDPKSYTVEVNLTEGSHRLTLEYFEARYDAQVRLDWERLSANQPPLALLDGPYTVDEGSVVNLDGRRSSDPDGSIARYEWDFNYNGRDFTVDATSGPMVSTRYPDGPTTIIVALRVTDNKGAMALATTQITVQNVAPAVKAGGPYSGLVGNMITLAGSAIDPGSIDQIGLIYRWEFGDGAEGGGPVAGHVYARPGTYTAKLTVTDKDGARASNKATVYVAAPNQPPQAVINGPTKGLVGEVLTFNGSGSRDSDGSIVGYTWEFGDGTASSGVNVTHSYAAPGTYHVILTVTDNGGLTGKATHTIQIEQPTPVNQPPQAIIDVVEQVSQTVTFSGSRSSDSDGNIVSYAWDFGDNTTSSGVNVSHVYTQSGTYKVTLTVTDNGGLAATAEHVIQIEVTGEDSQPALLLRL